MLSRSKTCLDEASARGCQEALGGFCAFEKITYSKTCVNGHFQKDKKLVFKSNYRLMKVKSIEECSKGSILQYF